MPSSYSVRARYTLQAPGENLNLWGVILNQGVFALVDDARAKRVAFALSGTKTLTTANGSADEARSAFLDITGGTGGTITIPSVEWSYDVRNASSGDVIITTGAGATATIAAGGSARVICDAANVRLQRDAAMATVAYVQGIAFGSVGDLPDVTGSAGRFVRSDGALASWQFIVVADIADYVADQATRAASIQAAALTAAKKAALFMSKHF